MSRTLQSKWIQFQKRAAAKKFIRHSNESLKKVIAEMDGMVFQKIFYIDESGNPIEKETMPEHLKGKTWIPMKWPELKPDFLIHSIKNQKQ
jgi:hypothetical protein